MHLAPLALSIWLDWPCRSGSTGLISLPQAASPIWLCMRSGLINLLYLNLDQLALYPSYLARPAFACPCPAPLLLLRINALNCWLKLPFYKDTIPLDPNPPHIRRTSSCSLQAKTCFQCARYVEMAHCDARTRFSMELFNILYAW
jgi:hypothetical protein